MTVYINKNTSHLRVHLRNIKYGHCFEIDGKVYKKLQPYGIDFDTIMTTGTGIPPYYGGCSGPLSVTCVIINDASGEIKKLSENTEVHEVNEVSIDYNLTKRMK
jgi:hypothetical protein